MFTLNSRTSVNHNSLNNLDSANTLQPNSFNSPYRNCEFSKTQIHPISTKDVLDPNLQKQNTLFSFKKFWKSSKAHKPSLSPSKTEPIQKNNIPNYQKILNNDLTSILNNNISLSYLFVSLIIDFSPEVILFFLEAREFSNNINVSKESRKKHAQIIWNAFIRKSAPLEININSSIRQHLLEEINKDTISPDVFSKPQAHMFNLLESTLINFIQKPIYNQMVDNITSINISKSKTQHCELYVAAQISNALKKTYGIFITTQKNTHPVPGPSVLNEHALTSSDLRTSLEAWAQTFVNRYLQMPLPTHESTCITLGYSMFETGNLSKKKAPFETKSIRTMNTASTFDNHDSSITVNNFSPNYNSNNVNINHNDLRDSSTIKISKKKVPTLKSRWWGK
ncbi:hypothetical protein BB559_006107 [Furculomyces boomerangus]|uniref:RGS domain-containing protein n=1 Tax=Furculomyces boomerangus TaxID=61424 RepID=A0A2T9Y4S4_9FUNG|nr:hypothetical protein BB559_006107 [Furculomyces boomerangus]